MVGINLQAIRTLCVLDIEKSAELYYNIGVAVQDSVSCQQTQGAL